MVFSALISGERKFLFRFSELRNNKILNLEPVAQKKNMLDRYKSHIRKGTFVVRLIG